MGRTEPQTMRAPEGMKRTIKASVFSDLFGDKKYLLQLYRTLHPEDTTATETDLTDITIENVMVDGLYNDLGFMVSNRLMILLEAQSTWTENILIRALLYMAKTWQRHLSDLGENLYASRRVKLAGRELNLTPKAVTLLDYLMSHPGELHTRDDLLASLWGIDFATSTRAVDHRIREIRQALGDDASRPTYIETVPSVGYRFRAGVQA